MTQKTGAIHDKFLKRIMFNPDTAGMFFREHLPEKWSSQMLAEQPELVHGDFIDEDLSEHQTDVLYKVSLTDGGTGFVYILTDHKSRPDYKIALQLQRYMNRIWSRLAEESEWRPLPEIWPVVIYNGNRRWNVPTNFAALFGENSNNSGKNIPDFEYHLIDLSQIPDDKLSSQRRLRAFLTIMKHIQRPDFLEHTDEILAELHFLDAVDAQTILGYIIKKWIKDLDQTTIDGLAIHIDPDKKDEVMASVVQEWVEQGKVQGKAEGIIEGKAEGKAELLIKLLERNFGSVSQDKKDTIIHSDARTIDTWFDKALNASGLDDVFGSKK